MVVLCLSLMIEFLQISMIPWFGSDTYMALSISIAVIFILQSDPVPFLDNEHFCFIAGLVDLAEKGGGKRLSH